jgi:hypothetical protein
LCTGVWPQPNSGRPLVVWAVSGSEPARPSVAGPCGPPSGAIVASGAAGWHEDTDPLPRCLVHTSWAVLHHRENDQPAVGDCSADLAQSFSSLPIEEFHALSGSAGEWLASYQEVPAGAGAWWPPAEDPRLGGVDHYPPGGRRRQRYSEVDTIAEHRRYAVVGWGGRGTGSSSAGHRGSAATTPSGGTTRGAVGSV